MLHIMRYMRQSAFEKAKSKIEGFFDASERRSFTAKALELVLARNRESWNLPENKTAENFINFLQRHSRLNPFVLYRSDNNDSVRIYTWATSDQLTVFTGLKSNAYYTHYTALFLNGLTEQIPKTYYLNSEHSAPQNANQVTDLRQENIDRAFSKEQRKSGEQLTFNQSTIILLNGQYTGRLGVVTHKDGDIKYAYTDITRTLIDVSIRPAYSGGVLEVLKAYRNIKGRLDVYKLKDYLLEMNFIYPYHQVIGFYLEKAGFSSQMLKLFEEKINLNFYLTYNMKKPLFSSRWRLYYPRGMDSIDTGI